MIKCWFKETMTEGQTDTKKSSLDLFYKYKIEWRKQVLRFTYYIGFYSYRKSVNTG